MVQRVLITVGAVGVILLLVVLAGVVGVLYARPATAQTSVGVPGMRQVTVVGHGESQGRPDMATVQIGVDSEAPTAKDALAQNNTQAQAVLDKLKQLGIAEKDIQTSNFSIYPTYATDGRQVTGYHVTNSVSVKIRNLDQSGTLLDQVVQAGANSISGISFSVTDPQSQLEQARKQAVEDAKARATQLATSGGATVGEMLVITENIGSQPPVPMAFERAAGAVADQSVPVQAGEQSFSVDVQVTFALR